MAIVLLCVSMCARTIATYIHFLVNYDALQHFDHQGRDENTCMHIHIVLEYCSVHTLQVYPVHASYHF